MTLPVLDKESYQHAASEWVSHAAQALREAGYLTADPSGTYDEDFAVAVAAFQRDKGIDEEDHVGPRTWDALGVHDTEPATEHGTEPDAAHEPAAVAVGAVSEDGQWQWDGTEWVVAAPQAAVAATDTVTETVAGTVSPDGQWQWDGAAWAAVTTKQAGADTFEDSELAAAVIDHEAEIMLQWKMALDSFNEVMESETSDKAKPDFASAMLKVFANKVLGDEAKAAKAGFVIDLLKGVLAEAERAKAAQKSVAFRNFYTTHQTHVANARRDLIARRAGFVASVRTEAERLLRNDPDSYGMLRMELMDLHADSLARLQSATQEVLFEDLTAEWTSQSTYNVSWQVDESAEIRIRVRDADLSIIDVVINAPDGDKLVDHLSGQPAGMDVWRMKAPKVLIFMDAAEHAVGYVRLDAGNRLANLPAEQDGKYKQRFQRVVDQGGLAPYKKA